MQKKLRGFSFFEVILYLGLFSVLATALLHFSWNVLDLGTKDYTTRRVFSDARFVTERMESLIRSASGIDRGASVLDNAQGKLVLKKLSSSDTVTISVQNGAIILSETGSPDVVLNSSDSKVVSLSFTQYGSSADHSEYISFTLSLQSVKNNAGVSSPYRATTTLWGGAFIRNDAL